MRYKYSVLMAFGGPLKACPNVGAEYTRVKNIFTLSGFDEVCKINPAARGHKMSKADTTTLHTVS